MSMISLVTGANRGIGREVCRQLAELGHTVILTARDPGPAAEAAQAVLSSEAAWLASMGGGTPAYTASKVVLNALTRMLADELRRDRVLVNAVCPRLGRHRHGRSGRTARGRGRGQRGLGGHPAGLRADRRLLPRRPSAALVSLVSPVTHR